MKIATNSAYTAQTTPASVGVKMPNLSPKMMMPGSASAHEPSTTARTTSRDDTLGGGTMSSFRASHHHATARPAPIRMPGTMPARNSFEIDSPAATPKTMKPIDGGMIGPMIPPAAIRPADFAGLCPALTIIGNRSAESAAASATAEPDSAARMHDATITT